MPPRPLLELRHLQMIREIAEKGRVTDAAEALGLTPSALSHRIREAERRLGVTLFVRLQKRLRMTPAAEHLADVADRVLAELERTEQDVRRMNRGVEHIVRLAVEAYGAYAWLPGFVAALAARFPEAELQVMAAAGRDPLKALANREIDVALISGAEERPGVARRFLFEDELVFVLPPKHRLAGRRHLSGPDIVGENFITFARTPSPDREFAKLFRPSESYPRWAATVEPPEAIIELVAAGRGVSVLAHWAVRGAIEAGRLVGARVGVDGVSIPWSAAVRAEDDGAAEAAGAPSVRVAEALAEYCAARGGLA